MSLRLRRRLNNLQGSLWFIPSLIVMGLIILAFVMVWVDRTLGLGRQGELSFFFAAGPEGTRDMLTTIAGSMLTVASVAFSFTIVVFSFASTQYSSRTLHSFMDDNTNQAVLGTLLGSFVYCILILRTVQLEEGNVFVPSLSASVALVLSIVDLGLFILFIHHVSEAIQAYHIIRRVGALTSRSVDYIFPRQLGSSRGISLEDSDTMLKAADAHQVRARANGYVQAVDNAYLLSLASKHDLLIIQTKGVGQFVIQDEVIAVISPASRVTESVSGQVRECLILGGHRTIFQDPEYGVLQLSDIAVKALSPAINDPNTAVMSLNELSRVLRQIARKEMPRHVLFDRQGKPRIITAVPTFKHLVSTAFDQIRRYGMADAAIPSKMLDVISEIAEVTELESERAALRSHVIAIAADADRSFRSKRDRELIMADLQPAMYALGITQDTIKPL